MHKQVKGGRTKKQRGGYYGAVGAIAPGAMQWGTASEMGGVGTRGGNTQTAGRRRKSRKLTKKSKLAKRRKMRGGNKYGGVSASFQGQGVAGMAQYNQTTSRGAPGTAAQGAFNNFGAAPGSKFNI
jgi:hypothetical protein